jgi:monothiol glutaredoxin
VRLLGDRHRDPAPLRRGDFFSVNVLADDQIRQGIKEYANWPTIPQLYVDGEFVGGCDIMREMYQSGELQTLLAKAPA